MKRHYKFTLYTLMLLGVVHSANAQVGDIINENFSGVDSLSANSVVRSVTRSNGTWTVMGCSLLNNGIYPASLYLNYNNGSNYAYVTTPAFNIASTCNSLLSFRCANTAANKHCSFSVIINGGGYFKSGLKTFDITIPTAQKVFNNISIGIYDVSASTTLTFKIKSSNYCVIDDIVVSTLHNVTLSETSTSNSISSQYADVTLNRTLTGDIWNTLCLPFNVGKYTLEQAFGKNQNIELRTFSSYTDGVMHFSETDTIESGKPFLIKINSTVTNPMFEMVEIKAGTPQTIASNGVTMTGIYNKTDVGTDALFLTSSGELKKPTSGSTTMKGLRAYFTAPAGARLTMALDDATAISNCVQTETDSSKWYTLGGQTLTAKPQQKGIYISNGKKIIIK